MEKSEKNFSGKYEQDADSVLEKKGVAPEEPLILLTLGEITKDVYQDFFSDAVGKTVTEKQRFALDKTFKHLSVIQKEKWRDDYRKNGYVMLYSPIFQEEFYLARDDQAFKSLKNKGLVVYMESELPRLKGLEKDDILWIHRGKKLGGKIVKEEPDEQRRGA